MKVKKRTHSNPKMSKQCQTNITDAFDAISNYEEMLIAQGEAMGMERGREHGIEEGYELGPRAAKSIASFGELIKTFELKNSLDDDIIHKLLLIRAKFKIIVAITGLQKKLVYSEEEIKAHKEMSF
ncbi:hypothetical protein CCR75_003709 [Bremia lactucae]|uniref:Essential protein Yae1 N-terminal domain-containing protein n=1 Tax=Bremia lactucae TaxID=4779 RepID=A0A976NYX1_BRELC|nr:hypothetical protein CCR75_003709 [Bremia lactucae]